MITTEVDVEITTEMEKQGQRQEQRSRAMYAAPRSVWTEQGTGKLAIIAASDGKEQIDYFGPAQGRYTKVPVDGRRPSPSFFNPEYPADSNQAFLFHRIAERLQEARIVRDEAAIRVVTATLEPAPPLPATPVPGRVAPRLQFPDSFLDRSAHSFGDADGSSNGDAAADGR